MDIQLEDLLPKLLMLGLDGSGSIGSTMTGTEGSAFSFRSL